MDRSKAWLAGVLLAACAQAHAADAASALADMAREHGLGGKLMLVCRHDGRIVAMLQFDAGPPGTVNQLAYRIDGSLVRWTRHEFRGGSRLSVERSFDVDTRILNGPIDPDFPSSLQCEPTLVRPKTTVRQP